MSNDFNTIRDTFLAALKEENLKKLKQLVEKLVKSYEKVPQEERKEFGIESLKIFNMQNYKGRNLIMIAADYGRADLLKKSYHIPEHLTDDVYSPKELQEVYNQRIFSYIAKDTQGSDQFFKKDNDSYNALMLTINSGHSECIRFLLSPETAITLNQKDKHGKTALIHAIESGDLNLIEEFLSVMQEILGGINQYDPKCKITLEIDDQTEKYLKKAVDHNENIKLTVTKFLKEIKEHIFMPCKIPLSSLKRKNAEQGNKIPDKKRKYDYENIEKKTLELIQNYTNLLKQTKNSVGINGLMIVKEYSNNIKQLIKNCTNFTPDHKSKLHKKLEILEKKRREIGKSLLKKLLNQASESDLTDEKKRRDSR
ncbi:ankyrin repeat domain-containing protein [Wolbachia endosymbiont of Chironomus riparius]|uniref:ankyrin repeat domain-containing protein n=1 Tax=Wolbachia endosymbiont of Chironomus riparius TaxID=2883238 RepID=UPI0020A0AE98|nr:ankyrin repeat domain-containing protein [Wolbachia endosymbiont of Chironomus riparius]